MVPLICDPLSNDLHSMCTGAHKTESPSPSKVIRNRVQKERRDCSDQLQGMERQAYRPPTCLCATVPFFPVFPPSYPIFSPFFPSQSDFIPSFVSPSFPPKYPVSQAPAPHAQPHVPVGSIPLKSLRWYRDTLLLTQPVGLTPPQWVWSLPCGSPGESRVQLLWWVFSCYWCFPTRKKKDAIHCRVYS